MSRCFPFPPPGYENKARPVDLNLVLKEKERRKKQKKDKDKNERRERKDKERAGGKHKKDKDRKHKKHKEKDKKEKQKSSEEKKIVRPSSENQSGEKPGPYNTLGNRADGVLVELGKRVGNGDEARDERQKFLEEKKIVDFPENQSDEKMGPGNKSSSGAHGLVEMGREISNGGKRDLKRKSSEDEKRVVRPRLDIQIGERPGPYNNQCDGGHNHIISAEMGKGVRNDEGATGKKDEKQKSFDDKKFVRPSGNQNHRNLVEMGNRVVYNDGAMGKTYNMNEKHKPSEVKNVSGPLEFYNSEIPGVSSKPGFGAQEQRVLIDMGKRVRADGATDNSYPIMSNGHSLGVDDKCLGNSRVFKVENGPCQANNRVEKKKERKEKTKLGNSVDEGVGIKSKNRDKEKEDKKRKREDKLKSKERKTKQRTSDGNLLDLCANTSVNLLKERWDKQGKLPELKEQSVSNEENGTPRSVISSCQVSQKGNGSRHPCQKSTIMPLAEDKQQALITNHTVNGSKLLSPQSVINVWNSEPCLATANRSSPKPLRACSKNHDVGNKDLGVNEVLPMPSITKDLPPHPDLKYLSEILTVSKIEPPPFIDDDEEWLFGCKDAKNTDFGSSMVECTEQVWADAVRLEAADVIAMPYVSIF